MFTGIVTAVGRIRQVSKRDSGLRLGVTVEEGQIGLGSCRTGDSISVSGACLTMLEPDAQGFAADLSAETLGLTTLGEKKTGDLVNLELALQVGDRLGGHLVSGHVDATVPLMARQPEGEAHQLEFGLPADLAGYVSRKGSVCLDGVSLTVNAVFADRFSVCIIPHTLAATTLDNLAEGDRVNLEVDMIARYLERLVEGGLE